jgi:hypothetical protein
MVPCICEGHLAGESSRTAYWRKAPERCAVLAARPSCDGCAPAVLGEEPARISGRSLMVDLLWLTHGPREPRAVARALLISGFRLGLGRTCAVWQCGASWALSRPAAGRCRAAHGLQNAMTGHGRVGSQHAVPWPASLTSYRPARYLRWTFQVPRGTVPVTREVKGPVTCAVLTTLPGVTWPAPRPPSCPVAWARPCRRRRPRRCPGRRHRRWCAVRRSCRGRPRR